MGLIYNPLSGNFDFTGASGGGPSGPAERFTSVFDASTSWGAPSGGIYTITVSQATHTRGNNPNIQLYELVSGNYELINVQSLVINPSGDISIQVPSVPDLRFAGLLLVI